MKDYLAKKGVGFYLTIVAAVMAAISLVFYSSATFALSLVRNLIIVVLVIEVLYIILTAVLGNKPFFNWVSAISAILMATALIQSFTTQLDGIGYYIAGLYVLEQILSFILFASCAAGSWLIYLIASYMNLGKE